MCSSALASSKGKKRKKDADHILQQSCFAASHSVSQVREPPASQLMHLVFKKHALRFLSHWKEWGSGFCSFLKKKQAKKRCAKRLGFRGTQTERENTLAFLHATKPPAASA